MTLLRLVVVVCALTATAYARGTVNAQADQSSEWVHIDGNKNPELIPEWCAWRTAFRRLGDGPTDPKSGRRLIPSELQDVLSEEEAQLLLKEGDAEHQRFAECGKQVDKLRERLTKGEQQEEIRKLNDEIELECRWQTIYARDRVVTALNDASRLALRRWVERLKADAGGQRPRG